MTTISFFVSDELITVLELQQADRVMPIKTKSDRRWSNFRF